MTDYRQSAGKLFLEISRRAIEANRDQKVAVIITEPQLKAIPGPGATAPLAENEVAAALPTSVQQWFCDIRLEAGGEIIRDVIVPTQARTLIGKKGSPIIVQKERTTGAWQIIGRADRITEVQSVKTYTTIDLKVPFARGLREDGAGGYVSPFYTHAQAAAANVSAAQSGKNAAGLHRGVTGVTSSGQPITSYQAGTYIEYVPFNELVWGVDSFGAYYVCRRQPDGTVVKTKVNP